MLTGRAGFAAGFFVRTADLKPELTRLLKGEEHICASFGWPFPCRGDASTPRA
jgi:hypothetical protein